MAYTIIPAATTSGGSSNPSTLSTYLARGQTAASLSATDTFYMWEDIETFASSGLWTWAQTTTGTAGASIALTNPGGGVVRYSTGATANSIIDNSGNSGIVAVGATTKWYFAVRFRLVTTADAQTKALFGIRNTANNSSFTCGVLGSGSTTNYIFQHGGDLTGSSIDSGTAINASFHTLEMYCTGDSTLRGKVDGGSEVSAAMSSPPTDFLRAFWRVHNGTTAANQAADVDWMLWMAARMA